MKRFLIVGFLMIASVSLANTEESVAFIGSPTDKNLSDFTGLSLESTAGTQAPLTVCVLGKDFGLTAPLSLQDEASHVVKYAAKPYYVSLNMAWLPNLEKPPNG